MKILIYSDYYNKKSGYAREIKDLIPHFKNAGHQIGHVGLGFTGYPIDDDRDLRVYPADVVVEGGIKGRNGVSSYFAPEILDFAIDDFKPDVVFTRQDYFCLKQIGLVLARPRGFKWVHWGLADGEPLGKNTEEPVQWIHEHIFTTEYTKKIVQAEHPNIDGEVIMPPINPVTWNIFTDEERKDLKKARADRRAKHGMKGYDVHIACVARNQRRKNLPVLFESIKLLKTKYNINALLMLVSHTTKSPSGEMTGWDLDHLVNHFGIQDNVYVAGRTDGKILHDEAVAELYAMADMFALPTMGEGFGLIFGEAMYSGLPIVTTNYSSCTEVVKDRGVLVEPKGFVWDMDNTMEAIVGAEDFAKGIKLAYEEGEEVKKEWEESGMKFVKELTPDKVAKRLLDVMERAVTEDKQPPALCTKSSEK